MEGIRNERIWTATNSAGRGASARSFGRVGYGVTPAVYCFSLGSSTDPLSRDTDGDGVCDGAEVAQNSDPADASDGGTPGSRVPAAFTFGDPSDSHSEKYRLTLEPVCGTGSKPRTVTLCNHEYGEADTFTAWLKPGWKYKVSLAHVATSGYGPEFPNYDYTLRCDTVSGVVLSDPERLFADFYLGRQYYGLPHCPVFDRVAHIYVLKAPAVVPDYDRDRKIGGNDVRDAKALKPFRWWVNDDCDVGGCAQDGGTDLTLQAWDQARNCHDYIVNGERDLLDFFPLMIDLSGSLALLDNLDELRATKLSVTVRSMRFTVVTGASPDNAGMFLRSPANCEIPILRPRPASMHSLFPVEKGLGNRSYTYEFPYAILLKYWHSQTNPIFMAECCGDDAELTVTLTCGNRTVCETFFRVSGMDVKQMYRWVNLRGAASGGVQRSTFIDNANCYPDATKNEDIVFLHGFRVNEAAAEAWGNEMFKRLYQSGFGGRLWMVAWRGDDGLVSHGGLNYHENVVHAFDTAPHLASFVNQNIASGSELTVIAHSLGNMVVSSALQDCGMRVPTTYFMCNAAVPSEAYLGTKFSIESGNVLIPDRWKSLPPRVFASCYHELFGGTNDDRRFLTWKNRFCTVACMNIFNFYSTGDEVLELANSPVGVLSGATSDIGRYAWHKQEMFKGDTTFLFASWHCWAGWGIGNASYWIQDPNPAGFGVMSVRPNTNAIENATNEQLKSQTVFTQHPGQMFTNVIPLVVRNQILARGIPALSSPAGGQTIGLKPSREQNINEDVFRRNGWGRNHRDFGSRWLHGDMKDMGYYYVYPLYDRFVTKGVVE